MDANAENVSKNPMTPSEKKARLPNEWFFDALHDYRRELLSVYDICQLVNQRMADAERRGFERAKELAKQAMAPMLRDMISRVKAWDLIENLRYEEA